GFTIVFNALDNLDAWRHVNKMCITANIPLIESGTTGFMYEVMWDTRQFNTKDLWPEDTTKQPLVYSAGDPRSRGWRMVVSPRVKTVPRKR
ncbi:uncharacterized protein LY89DRAFT_596913, partial [Mollisia scopiformis]